MVRIRIRNRPLLGILPLAVPHSDRTKKSSAWKQGWSMRKEVRKKESLFISMIGVGKIAGRKFA